jgi:2-dehydro-3-deoxygluconokinase
MTMLQIRSEAECKRAAIAMGAFAINIVVDGPSLSLALANEASAELQISGAELNPIANLGFWGYPTAFITATIRGNELFEGVSPWCRKRGVELIAKDFPYDGVREPSIAIVFRNKVQGIAKQKVTYCRSQEAAAQLKPNDFDLEQIFSKDGARIFHTGGLYAAISSSSKDLITETAKVAKRNNTIVSYDLNYREMLWRLRGGMHEAQMVNDAIMKHVDVLFANEEDLQLGLGISGPDICSGETVTQDDFAEMLNQINCRFPQVKIVANTRRHVHLSTKHDWKAVLWFDGQFFESRHYVLEDIVDRVGGGDGFAAGVLSALLDAPEGIVTKEVAREAAQRGAASGALATACKTDVMQFSLADVKSIGNARVSR